MGAERRGRAVECRPAINQNGRNCVGETRSAGKSFDIPKKLIWEAYLKVSGNKGAAGADRQSLAEFEQDLRNNLFKLWSASSRTGGEAVISCS